MRPDRRSLPAQDGPIPSPALLPQVFYSPRGEPALVAWVPVALPASKQRREGARLYQAAKESLARFLVERVLERQVVDLTLELDPLGRPRARLGAAPGPSLSFSWCSGRLWAAAGRSENGLGLDAAAPGEFTGSYPHRRVFREAEWQTALIQTGGEQAEAAALLWSVKEAVVKARGCAFHFLGPRQVQVHFNAREGNSWLWRGCLEEAGQDGDLSGGPEPCLAVSVRLQDVWLAAAWCRVSGLTSPSTG
jgi:phosphopantetheinyl transferase